MLQENGRDSIRWLQSGGESRISAPGWSARPVGQVTPVSFRKPARHADSQNKEVAPVVAEDGKKAKEGADLVENNQNPKMEDDAGIRSQEDEKGESAEESQAQEQDLAAAYERGMEEGKSMAQEQLKLEMEKELEERGLKSAKQLGTLLGQIRRQGRALVVELATAVAGKILGREIEQDENWIMQNIQSCLDRRIPNGPMRLRVHPRVRERLLGIAPAPAWLEEMTSEGPAIKLVADAKLEPGDCILESDRIRIDARVDVQVDAVRQVLESLVASEFFVEEP